MHNEHHDGPARPDSRAAAKAAKQFLKKGKATHWERARRHFFAGLLVIVPAYIAVWAIFVIMDTSEKVFGDAVHYIFQLDRAKPGFYLDPLQGILSFILALVVLMGIGYLSTFFFIKKIILFGEALVSRLPFIKFFYLTPKEVLNTLTMPRDASYKRVVLVEYPRRGVWAFAFATGEIIRQPEGRSLVAVFLPTTPNPTSGFLLFFPEEDVTDTNVSVEDGARLIISGGILTPEEVYTQKFQGLRSEPDLPPLGPLTGLPASSGTDSAKEPPSADHRHSPIE